MERIRAYETVFILKPDMEEEAREALQERIQSIITTNGGEITEVDVWGSKKLAYEVKDYRTGHYTVLYFNATSEVINELERNFKIIDDVLRYLIVRKED